MKKLIILLLLSYSLFAQSIDYTIPLALQKKLCDQLAQNNNRCENGSTLDYDKHALLDDNKLLVFVYLNEHKNTNSSLPKATVPILIDSLGHWISTVGENIISEEIQSIHQDPHGNIWVRAIWEAEGTYPSYYHSKDGLHWRATVLPKNRNVDCCFESADKPIFLFDTITLTFRDIDNKNVKSWKATYQSAMSKQPIWQFIKKAPSSSIENIKSSNWKVTKSKNKVTFFNAYTKKQLFIPIMSKTKKTVYLIQIGAYKKKSSAIKAQNALDKLPYSTHIKKSKKYTKLFIGEYDTLKKAKFMLAKIKREYPKNKTLQKAFILTSKP